ncbi:SusD/RagB family nutrient-binding outer membrane lipoprotein [Chitinophaga caseinilytica]|uniref:SusD/RagB family nutrient-binding outer membrane lipoprotein n=1 Tax=Chitinophaga caseinilytica TaxID=2267521 RepID=A0ABZ2YY98_9BACT
MRKQLITIMLAGALVSCTKDLTSLNDDLKNPEVVPPGTLFASAERELFTAHASPNVYINVFRVITQYWQQTTYNQESQYELEGNALSGAWWRDHYFFVIKNIHSCRKWVKASEVPEEVRKNQLALLEVLEVTAYYYLTTTFGNVPYKEAINDDNSFPKYDDAKGIYTDLLARLTAAIGDMDDSAESFGDSDLIYAGDVAAWKKMAASLKLKMAILIADSDGTAAQTAGEDAVELGVFTSADDNFALHFLASPPYTNPVYEELVQSGRIDFVACKTIVDTLASFNDPRMTRFFRPVPTVGGFKGAPPGTKPDYRQFSRIHRDFNNPELPGIMLDYPEVEMLLAEAKQRGWNVSGSAADHYEAGVRGALESWNIPDAEITQYLAQPKVAYDAANWKKSIGVQKWIAFFNRGADGWTDFRRLDFPKLQPAQNAISGFPVRYRYPVSEHNINRRNYEAAAQAMGGDKVETKLWWDKF